MMFDKSLWHKVWILRGLVWSQWLNFIIHVALFQVGIFYDSMFYLYKIYSSFLKTKENNKKKYQQRYQDGSHLAENALHTVFNCFITISLLLNQNKICYF